MAFGRCTSLALLVGLWGNLLVGAEPAPPLGIPATEAADTHPTPLELSEAERVWLLEHPAIRVAQDTSWVPVEFADARGEPSGMSADYLKLIEHRLGVAFRPVRKLSWFEVMAGLQRHEIDMTTSGAATPDTTWSAALTTPSTGFSRNHWAFGLPL